MLDLCLVASKSVESYLAYDMKVKWGNTTKNEEGVYKQTEFEN